MVKKLTNVYGFVVVLAILTGSVVAQSATQFSALIVENTDGRVIRHRLYVGKDKARVEPETPAAEGAIVILDFSRGTSYVLIPNQKQYVETSGLQASPAKQMTFLNPVDPLYPCNLLPQSGDARQARAPCAKAGTTVVNGRTAIQWIATLPDGREAYVWVDAKLGLMIKSETLGNRFEMQDIREEEQPSTLFELPTGYSRMKM